MSRIALVLAAAAAGLVLAAPATPAPPLLTGTVGLDDAFKISLTRGGKRVTTLKAGLYRIRVRDLSTIHNFHLIGRGVNKLTPVATKAAKTWTVRLKRGTYRYMCDAHPTTMKGSFRVT